MENQIQRSVVDVAGAAEITGYSVSTLNKKRSSGDGPPFVRLGPGRVVYRVEALDAWLRSREVSTDAPLAGR